MSFNDTIVTFLVLFGIFIIIYTKIKHQDLKDTMEEIKDMINPISIQGGVAP